jgi:hypothetical protein
MTLAWLARSGSEDLVVFATTEATAMELAIAEFGESPCRVERDVRFDSYSPGPVKAKKLVMEYGLSLACPGCQRGVWKEKAELENQAPFFDHDQAFCNKHCHIAWHKQRERDADEIDSAKAQVIALCPDAKFERWWTRSDKLGTLEVTVQFRIPGGKDLALWRSGDPKTINLARSDSKTWYEYLQSRRVH